MSIEIDELVLEAPTKAQPRKFYGKYAGTVINNVDPMMRGRIQVQVAGVSNLIPSTWALPCLPVGGPQHGFFAVPMIGASVWVEFEQGDPDHPIWTGCFWGNTAEVPAMSKMALPPIPAMFLQTALQNGIMISDVPGPSGGIMIKSTMGASIIVNDTGIYIQNGKGAMINLVGPTVIIQNGAGAAVSLAGPTTDVNMGGLTVT